MTPKYKVSYIYDNPGRAGPFKGTAIETRKYTKGDMIWAVMGRATVKSCREVKQ